MRVALRREVTFPKLIKINTFNQNQFMTCYLIFNFRPIYFSYFRKITANSNSHNGGSKTCHPRSQGVKLALRNGEVIQYGLIIYSKTLRERVFRHKLNFRTTRSLNLPIIAKWLTKNGSKLTALIFNEEKIQDINFWLLWCTKNGNWDLIKVR